MSCRGSRRCSYCAVDGAERTWLALVLVLRGPRLHLFTARPADVAFRGRTAIAGIAFFIRPYYTPYLSEPMLCLCPACFPTRTDATSRHHCFGRPPAACMRSLLDFR